MKIMQVIPNFGYGGAETMCANLSIELKNMGHEVIVVSLYDLKSSIVNTILDANIKFLSLGKKEGFDIRFFLKLAKIVCKEKPDVIHSHLYSTKYVQIIATFLRIKTKVFTIHNEADKDGTKIDHFFNRFLLEFFNVIPVTLSSDLVESSCKVYGKSLEHMPVIFNGISLSECKPLVSYSKKALKFLHVGRFVEAKNHEGLIKGFLLAKKKCPDIELFLYGDGYLKDKIAQMIEDNDAGLYIHLCGISTNIYSVMHNVDVFILPSLWEGFPMTLIEAMGTGLPIISSNVGGVSNMLEHGVTSLMTEPDCEGICESIVKLYDNQLLRQTIGMNALKKSVEFSAKKMTQKYLKVYGNVYG